VIRWLNGFFGWGNHPPRVRTLLLWMLGAFGACFVSMALPLPMEVRGTIGAVFLTIAGSLALGYTQWVREQDDGVDSDDDEEEGRL
jgi:hypothetical protein